MSTGEVGGIRPPITGFSEGGVTGLPTHTPSRTSDVLEESREPIHFDRKPVWSPKAFFANLFGGATVQKSNGSKNGSGKADETTLKMAQISSHIEEKTSTKTTLGEQQALLAQTLKDMDQTLLKLDGEIKKLESEKPTGAFEVAYLDKQKAGKEIYKAKYLKGLESLEKLNQKISTLNEEIKGLTSEKEKLESQRGSLPLQAKLAGTTGGSALCGCLGRLK
jgi:hypothetical protein